MKIWVDADACPNVIKDILFRAAQRTQTETILVANHRLSIPASDYIRFLQVPKGFDVADNEIVKRVEANDLVITTDIPLASEVIEKGAHCLTSRGEVLDKGNISARLTMRDFMETMRSSGMEMSGPKTLSAKDRQTFAQHLESALRQAL